MTSARRILDRMTCPTCGRTNVAFRLIRDPRHTRGMTAPGIRVPRDHRIQLANGKLGDWCRTKGEP